MADSNYLLKLNKLIKQRKIKKEKLAVQLDISRQGFMNYLNGSQIFRIDTFIDLCEILQMPISWFFNEDELVVSDSITEYQSIQVKYIDIMNKYMVVLEENRTLRSERDDLLDEIERLRKQPKKTE